MKTSVLLMLSSAYILASCSDPPPTAENYVDHTRTLERIVAGYVHSGARNMKWSDLRAMVDDHVAEWGEDSRQPVACKQAANALAKSVWRTLDGWNNQMWIEAYREYVDKQVDCEKAVEGKPTERVLPSMLTPGNGVPPWGG